MLEWLSRIIPEEQMEHINEIGIQGIVIYCFIYFIIFLLILAIYFLVAWLIIKLSKKVFKRIERKKGNSISLQFMEKAVTLMLLMIFVVLPMGGKKVLPLSQLL